MKSLGSLLFLICCLVKTGIVMLERILDLLREGENKKAYDEVRSASIKNQAFEKIVLFYEYYLYRKLKLSKEDFDLYVRRAKQVGSNHLPKKYADADYLSIYEPILSKNSVDDIVRLNQDGSDDFDAGSVERGLFLNEMALDDLLKISEDGYKKRFLGEYKYLLNDGLEIFPYKYLTDYYHEKSSVPVTSTPISKISLIYCVKNRSVRTHISVTTAIKAYREYKAAGGQMEVEIILCEDVGQDLVHSLERIDGSEIITHYLVETGIGWTRSGLLNYGLKRCSGDVVAFCDVDFLFPKEFFFKFSKEAELFDFKKNILVVNCIETHKHLKGNKTFSPFSPYGYMWVVDRASAVDVGGFSESFTGHGFEDRDFEFKLTHHAGLGIVGSLSLNDDLYIFHLSHNERTGSENREQNKKLYEDAKNLGRIENVSSWGEYKLLRQTSYGSKGLPVPELVFDLAILCHNSYHAWTAKLIKDEYEKRGRNVLLISPLPNYADEGVETYFQSQNLPFLRAEEFSQLGEKAPVLMVFNDWDQRVSRPLVEHVNAIGGATIGLIEGINDYNDVDTGRVRNAYRTVQYVLAPGRFEIERYFHDRTDKSYIVGIPRLNDLERRPLKRSNTKVALVNANFTYGVLEEHRDEWVSSVVSACVSAGYKPVLTVHRADSGDYSAYEVTTKTFYDALADADIFVSRFSSCIIESIVLGVKSIYYNYGFERVDKFLDSMGAYYTPSNFEELVDALVASKRESFPLKGAEEFLRLHANYPGSEVDDVADAVDDIVKRHRFKRLS